MQKSMYDLTTPQKLIWYTEEVYKGTPIENITGTVTIPEKVDFTLLEKAINVFVERNDSFRLRFLTRNNQIKQYIEDFSSFYVDIVDINSDKELKEFEEKVVTTVFDVFNSFLYNFIMFRFPDGHGGFIINMHHLISDAWSAGLGASEIIKIYTRLIKNEHIDDITYPTYIDYINSEQEYFQSEKFNKDKSFWNSLFKSVPDVSTIPSSIDNKSNLPCCSNRVQFTMPNKVLNEINDLCKSNRFSIFNFFMSVFAIYIGKVSGLDEFVVGTPVLNRCNIKEKHTSGMFVSTVPLKMELGGNIQFAELASTVSSKFFNIFKHQKYPYLSLLKDLRSKDKSIPNLYNILISYQNIRSTAQVSETPYEINWVPNKYIADNIDIHIYDMNDTGNINIAYDYQTSRYSKQDIIDIHNRILNIINQVLQNVNIGINDVEIVTHKEKDKILHNFNNTKLDYPKDKTIVELFEEQVQKTPDNIAVVFGTEKLTYKELNEKANSLATYLRNKGIQRNDLVGVMVNRSLEMIIGILAVLKAGGAYIPIDPTYPKDRIDYMLKNSNSKLLLTQNHLRDLINFKNSICIDLKDNEIYSLSNTNLENVNVPEDLAYVIYTSGSTGLPKGVMLKQNNIINFIYGMMKEFAFTNKDTIVSITTFSFDIFVLESLLPLLNGIKMVIASEEEQTDINMFNDLCKNNNVTVLQTTPSRLQAILAKENSFSFITNLKYILVGGEPFPPALLKTLQESCKSRIYNMYGPTETAVWSSLKDLTNSDKINIGRPIANTQMYILDKFNNPLPIGITGELFIAGDGVCKGYLNNLELTTKVFINNPFVPNTLMYKTGDLCKLLPNGEIEYLERVDNQIKIRGLRIELGEIESQILAYNGIEKACVIKQTINNRDFISAYFTAKSKINITSLKKHLSNTLPKYMIPSYFTVLDKFPYTPNGKIDKKALKLPEEILSSSRENEYVAPRTDLEKQFVSIWEQILNVSPIGITDNFFELGGDSILAMNLNIELKTIINSISYADIFKFPTISELVKKSKSTDEDYDFKYMEKNYEKYTTILSSNTKTPSMFELKYKNCGNILLTGATGFLGIHILDKFISNEKGNVYCIVRQEPGLTAAAKLHQKLNYYFGNKYDKLLGKRIFAITGDICKPVFGLNQEDLLNIANNVDIVVNTAARVAHYGNYYEFYNTNVKSVQYAIDFCKSFNKKLYHISTLSVSGNSFDSNIVKQHLNHITYFRENSLYIGQSLENVYIRSKFEAECLVLDAILDGLDAYILRVRKPNA